MFKYWVIHFSYKDRSTAVHFSFPIHLLLQFKCIDTIYDKTNGKYLSSICFLSWWGYTSCFQRKSLHNSTATNFSQVIWCWDRIILWQVNTSIIKREIFFKWHLWFHGYFCTFWNFFYYLSNNIISRAVLVQLKRIDTFISILWITKDRSQLNLGI